MAISIENLNLQLLNVGFAHHNADWNWQNVSSPFTRIYLVTEGKARLHLYDRAWDLHPGHLYIVPPHTMHSYECHGVFGHYYLHFYEGFKSETNLFEMYDFPVEVEAADLDHHLFADLCRTYPDARLPESNPAAYDNASNLLDYVKRYNALSLGQKIQLRGAMLILFSRFLQKATPRMWTADERMMRLLTYVNTHIYDEIDIDVLADLACVTKYHLIRLFKKEFDVTPMQYINMKKLERSQLLLLTSDTPVKDVAYTLGFSDYSYFIRQFKKVVGVTPQEYRHSMR